MDEQLQREIINLKERLRMADQAAFTLGRISAQERARIAALEALLREAVEVLGPMAEAAPSYDPDEGDGAQAAWAHDFTIGTLRAAANLRERITKTLEER